MPRPKANRPVGARPYGNDSRAVIPWHARPTPLKPTDCNIGREGYRECGACGFWVRVRTDGTLSAHATDGRRMNIRKVPCLGGDGHKPGRDKYGQRL